MIVYKIKHHHDESGAVLSSEIVPVEASPIDATHVKCAGVGSLVSEIGFDVHLSPAAAKAYLLRSLTKEQDLYTKALARVLHRLAQATYIEV